MRIATTEQEIEKLKEETNAEATERIGREFREEKAFERRKNCVMSWFKGLTGREMTLAEFLLYDGKFKKAEAGYNIKSFIRDIGEKCIE